MPKLSYCFAFSAVVRILLKERGVAGGKIEAES